MRYQPLFGSLILAMVLLSSNGPKKASPTNYDVLNWQIDTVAAEVSGVLAGGAQRLVNLRTGSNEVDAFVRQRILEGLLKNSLQVVGDSAVSNILQVRVPLVEVNYSSPVASHIFGPSDVVRTVRSDFDVEMSDSGRVKYAKTFTMAYVDTVSESDIPDLEAGSYSFLHGRIESRNFFDTVFQPLLFAASAAVIVYLFFTLRGS
jgi:hypothetical protein